MSSSNNKHDLSVKLLGDLANIFDSLLPAVEYAKKIKTDLRSRGVDKILKDIYRIISNCIQKKAHIINVSMADSFPRNTFMAAAHSVSES